MPPCGDGLRGRFLLRALNAPFAHALAAANWAAIADTSGEVLFREVDFNHERESAQIFAKNFAKTKTIKIPEVHADLSSSKVLTMEYVPGVKISNAEQLERDGLIEASAPKSRWNRQTLPGVLPLEILAPDHDGDVACLPIERDFRGAPPRIYLAEGTLETAPAPGDRVLFYHSGEQKAAVGVAEVTRAARADGDAGNWVSVAIRPLDALRAPVKLAAMKAAPALADMAMLRQSRLSVSPVTRAQWDTIMSLTTQT